MTQVFHDWEFLEDGRTIDPISVGMVLSTGEAYYAVYADAPWDRILENNWLCENVLPHLPHHELYRDGSAWEFSLDTKSTSVKPGWVIANEIREFTQRAAEDSRVRGEELELWGDYSDYDHVVLMQQFGAMINKPEHLPMRTFDVQQFMHMLGLTEEDMPQQAEGSGHMALSDAEQVKRKYDACKHHHDHNIRVVRQAHEHGISVQGRRV